jgi:hypothetical protein
MASPFDFTALLNMIMQILPFVIILAILPMIIKLITGAFSF